MRKGMVALTAKSLLGSSGPQPLLPLNNLSQQIATSSSAPGRSCAASSWTSRQINNEISGEARTKNLLHEPRNVLRAVLAQEGGH